MKLTEQEKEEQKRCCFKLLEQNIPLYEIASLLGLPLKQVVIFYNELKQSKGVDDGQEIQ